MGADSPYKITSGAVLLFVRLKPNSRIDKIDALAPIGLDQTSLSIRIKQPATENKANKALIKFIARKLNYPQSKISLLRGQKSRDKTLQIEGDITDIKLRLEGLLLDIEE